MKAAQRQQIPCSYGRCAPSVACTAGMAEHGLALVQRPSDRTLSGSTGLGVHEPVLVCMQVSGDAAPGGWISSRIPTGYVVIFLFADPAPSSRIGGHLFSDQAEAIARSVLCR